MCLQHFVDFIFKNPKKLHLIHINYSLNKLFERNAVAAAHVWKSISVSVDI